MLIRISALLVAGALGQVPGLSLQPATPAEVRASIAADPNARILEAEITRVETVAQDAIIGHHVTRVYRTGGAAARALLPDVQFYSVSYSMFKRPGFENEHVSLAWITYTLAVRPKTGEARPLLSDGDYSALFNTSGVAIRNVAEARRVWSAFREIYHAGFSSGEVRRVSATEWRLGTNAYFVRVTTASGSGRIVGWQLASGSRPK